MLEKYGFESYQSTQEYRDIIKEKFGVENISQLQSVKDRKKESCLKNFGVEYSLQSETVKEKSRKTWMSRLGVDNPTKNKEVFEKAQSSAYHTYKYSDTQIKYQGSYELNFIEYCIDNKIEFENGPSIKYKMLDKNRIYHSDFYIPKYNLICEVKSLYTYKDDYDENILKQEYSMISGYNFLFIIDKNYTELEKIIKENEKKDC